MIYLCSVLRVYLKVGLNDLYLGAWIKNYNKKILQSAVVLDLSNKVICNCAHKRKRNLTIISTIKFLISVAPSVGGRFSQILINMKFLVR